MAFKSVLPNGGDIVVSEESATYRPEMDWFAAQLNDIATSNLEHPVSKWRVAAENYEPQPGRDVYRFFELFDLPNHSEASSELLKCGGGRRTDGDAAVQTVSGGENVVRALLAASRCGEFWRRELGDKYFLKLQEVIPYTWLLDPTPLAATRGHSAAGDSRLARSSQVQSERARPAS